MCHVAVIFYAFSIKILIQIKPWWICAPSECFYDLASVEVKGKRQPAPLPHTAANVTTAFNTFFIQEIPLVNACSTWHLARSYRLFWSIMCIFLNHKCCNVVNTFPPPSSKNIENGAAVFLSSCFLLLLNLSVSWRKEASSNLSFNFYEGPSAFFKLQIV